AAGCAGPTAAQTKGQDAGPPPEVTTVKPERKTIRRTTDQPGQVKAFEETPLFAKISGYVVEPKVDIGDEVEKDQLLAELSVPEMDEELRQKESLVAQAQADVKQAEANFEAAQAAVNTAKAKVKVSQAAIQRAEADVARWTSELKRIEELAAAKAIQE